MAKIIAVVLVLSAFVLAPVVVEVEFSTASAAKLPWSTFSGATADVVNAQLGMCPGGEIALVHLQKAGVDYLYAYAPETQRLVFVVYDAAGNPAEIGLGRVNANTHDVIPKLVWSRFDPARHRGPCSVLFPEQA